MAGNEVLFEVLADPSAIDGEDRLRQYFAGGSLDAVLALLQDFRANDLIVERNADVPAGMFVVGEPALVDDVEPSRAIVRTCELDSDIVLGVLDDGVTRFPLDDEVYRYVSDSNLELVDGRWMLAGGEQISEDVGVTSCDS